MYCNLFVQALKNKPHYILQSNHQPEFRSYLAFSRSSNQLSRSSKPHQRSGFNNNLSRNNLRLLGFDSLGLGPRLGCGPCSYPLWVDVVALPSKRPDKASNTISLSFEQSVIAKIVDLNKAQTKVISHLGQVITTKAEHTLQNKSIQTEL